MSDSELQKNTKSELSIDFRSAVSKLEQTMRSMADGETIVVGTKDKPIVTDSHILPIEHFFMDGVYIRKMTMHEGVSVVGAIHKHLHMCFLTEGHLIVADESGTKEYIAPCHIVATPGVQRVLYAIEDSIWYNTHKNPTNTEDVRVIENNTVVTSYEEYEEYIKNK